MIITILMRFFCLFEPNTTMSESFTAECSQKQKLNQEQLDLWTSTSPVVLVSVYFHEDIPWPGWLLHLFVTSHREHLQTYRPSIYSSTFLTVSIDGWETGASFYVTRVLVRVANNTCILSKHDFSRRDWWFKVRISFSTLVNVKTIFTVVWK